MEQKQEQRSWYKARLTPAAQGLYTDAFYPDPKQRTGAQYVFFTEIDITPTRKKIIVASRFEKSGVRLMTHELAQKCLEPTVKATRAEAEQLNTITTKVKI